MLPASIATAKMFTARMRVVSDHRPDHFNERSSLFFGESVADAIERFDCLEALVDGAELLAKPLDMAVDGAVVDIDVILICGVHQLVARFHKAGALRQRFQDHELGDGKRHVASGPGHPRSDEHPSELQSLMRIPYAV